jgi:hypothetical protein
MVYIKLEEDNPYRWGMAYSFCRTNGPIVRYIQTLVEQINPNKKLMIPVCDGLSDESDYKPKIEHIVNQIDQQNPDILGLLCTRNYTNPNTVYLPLDDDTFINGLTGIPTIPWELKQPVAFWRGGTSGHPFIRKKLVERTNTNPWLDIKFVHHYGKRELPDEYFTESVGLDTYVRHKYICIVDGAVISSSHQWVFGSGSVPILITHPDNNFWFKSHLKPWHNYVPVSYSLNDLEPAIQWLKENDSKAKQIAENAMKLSQTIFTPHYQKEYIKREVERVLKQ